MASRNGSLVSIACRNDGFCLRKSTVHLTEVTGTVGVSKSSLNNTIATDMSDGSWQEHALTGRNGAGRRADMKKSVEKEEKEKEKAELQRLIKKRLKHMGHRLKRPTMTVAVVGKIGVGKSSFINTIATAMSNGSWQEHALTGQHFGEARPITAYMKRYQQCCRHEEHQNPHIPTLVDIGGIPNQVVEELQEVLKMVFCGQVPEKENLLNVYDYIKTRDDIRKPQYKKVYEHLKVDRVVVVCSATEEVPEALLKAVVEAARPMLGNEKISIPVFGVMTKYDLIDEENKEAFHRREKLFKDLLGLNGAETRYLRCSNYCDGTDPDNKRIRSNMTELDVPILRLMTQICDPAIEADNQKQDPVWLEFTQGFQYLVGAVFVLIFAFALKILF